jgi:hypothetical protein
MAFVVLSESAAARVRADPAAGDGIKAAVAQHVADAKIAYKHLVGGVQFVDDIPKNPRCVLLPRRCSRACINEPQRKNLEKDPPRESEASGKPWFISCQTVNPWFWFDPFMLGCSRLHIRPLYYPSTCTASPSLFETEAQRAHCVRGIHRRDQLIAGLLPAPAGVAQDHRGRSYASMSTAGRWAKANRDRLQMTKGPSLA